MVTYKVHIRPTGTSRHDVFECVNKIIGCFGAIIIQNTNPNMIMIGCHFIGTNTLFILIYYYGGKTFWKIKYAINSSESSTVSLAYTMIVCPKFVCLFIKWCLLVLFKIIVRPYYGTLYCLEIHYLHTANSKDCSCVNADYEHCMWPCFNPRQCFCPQVVNVFVIIHSPDKININFPFYSKNCCIILIIIMKYLNIS